MSRQLYNPVTGEYISRSNKDAEQIRILNEMCSKCPSDKIYQASNKRCVKRDGKRGRSLIKQIEYCDNLSKEVGISDKSFIDNILNITIPGEYIKRKKPTRLRSILKHPEQLKRFSLARHLNVKDIFYKQYVDLIPTIIYSVITIIISHPRARGVIIEKMMNIYHDGSFLGSVLKNLIQYVSSPFIINVLSKIPIRSFVEFISGVFKVSIRLPRITKSSINNIANTALIGDTRSRKLSIKRSFKDSWRQYKINDEYQKDILLDINSYDENKERINLSKLGLNTKDFYKQNSAFTIDYDDKKQIPIVKVSGNPDISNSLYYIIPVKDRKREIANMNKDIDDLVKTVEKETKRIKEIRDNIKKTNEISLLKQVIRDLKEKKDSHEKFTMAYKKASHDIIMTERKISSIIRDAKYKQTNISDKELSLLQPKYKTLVSTKTTLTNIKNQMEKVNETNLNAVKDQILSHIQNVKDSVDSMKDNIISLNTFPVAKNDIDVVVKKLSPKRISDNLDMIKKLTDDAFLFE